MILEPKDIGYNSYEEMLEKRLKTYISLETLKKKEGINLFSKYQIYPKHSKSLTNVNEIVELYFEVVNNLEFHFFEDQFIILRGFMKAEDEKKVSKNFILITTPETFKVELFSIFDNKTKDSDEIYFYYIVRIPSVDKSKSNALDEFLSYHSKKLKHKNKYYLLHHERVIRRSADYKVKNKERIKKQKQDYYKRTAKQKRAYAIKYKKDNEEKVRKYNMERRLWHKSFKDAQFKNNSKFSIEILGCDVKQFKIYIQNQFTENMNWFNYGQWSIKHKIPITDDLTEEEITKLNHYTNLQPVWNEV